MVHSPAHRWENGVLVERAIATNEPGDPVEDDEFVSGTKPHKTPVPTTFRDALVTKPATKTRKK